jgi:uroporphyrin-3 C-methyltransferase
VAGRGVSRSLLAATLAVAALISVVVWLDGRRTQQVLRAEVAQRLGGIEANAQNAAKVQAELASALRDAQAKLALVEARLAESQEQQASLEALYRDLAPSREEIALSEIEQVLLVANQQLQLAGNVQGALAALQLAESKLQRLERPQFLPLRRALARDIDRLKAVPFVDVPGSSLKIDQTIAAVDTLPLAIDERLPDTSQGRAAPAPEEISPWRRLARDIWSDIRQLVRIEVMDRPVAPLVPPPQQYFLRENLKLRLLSARIGLLNHDAATFKADVAAAESWLRQYFDTRSQPVQAVQATLRQLATTEMPSDLPDLARTLDAARVLRLAAERSPGRGAPGERAR